MMSDDTRVEQTRYTTEFAERETGNELFCSGQYIGTLEIPEGRRPFPDRVAVYEVVEIHKAEPGVRGVDAVMDAAEAQD